MTDSYQQLLAYVDRLEVYLVVIIGLFTVALIATAVLLFWPFKDEGEEG